MDHCTLYSHQLMYDQLLSVLNTHLPDVPKETSEKNGFRKIVVKQKGGLFNRGKDLNISYRERLTPDYKLNQTSCPLEENLAGMLEFVSSIPAVDTQIKELFEDKIATINSELVFSTSGKYSAEAIAILKDLLKTGHPFVFAQPGKFFKESETQHFLNHELKLLLDIRGNTAISDLEIEIDDKYLSETPKTSASARNRKLASEAILVPKGVKINIHLPPISESIKLREKWELIDRIYALFVVASKGSGVSENQILDLIQRFEITTLSEQEKKLVSSETLSDQEKAFARWRYESLFTLMWSVGLIDTLPFPSSTAPSEALIKQLVGMDRKKLSEAVTLRSIEEILDMLDLVYRMNWACMEAKVKHREPTGNLNAGVVYERYYALNWLVSHQDADWDEVTLDF